MTTIEHMMLASVFGCVWGWLLGSIIFIVADLIHTAIRKRKDKREKQRQEAMMAENKKKLNKKKHGRLEVSLSRLC